MLLTYNKTPRELRYEKFGSARCKRLKRLNRMGAKTALRMPAQAPIHVIEVWEAESCL
jgi:hypothetical protein